MITLGFSPRTKKAMHELFDGKVCCDCGQTQPLVQFGLTGRRDGGRMDWCRECHGVRIRVWRDGYRPA